MTLDPSNIDRARARGLSISLRAVSGLWHPLLGIDPKLKSHVITTSDRCSAAAKNFVHFSLELPTARVDIDAAAHAWRSCYPVLC